MFTMTRLWEACACKNIQQLLVGMQVYGYVRMMNSAPIMPARLHSPAFIAVSHHTAALHATPAKHVTDYLFALPSYHPRFNALPCSDKRGSGGQRVIASFKSPSYFCNNCSLSYTPVLHAN
jgi:hypothetical protein